MSDHMIQSVGPQDLNDLLALMRAYCDFYEVAPPDEDLLAMSTALISDPELEGVQLIAVYLILVIAFFFVPAT